MFVCGFCGLIVVLWDVVVVIGFAVACLGDLYCGFWLAPIGLFDMICFVFPGCEF